MRPFVITWGDRSWTDEQCASAHVIAVADVLGTEGFEVSPWDGPKQLAAWIAVLLAASRVSELDEVTDATVAQLTSVCVGEVYVSRPDALLSALAPRLLSVPPVGDAVEVAA